MNRFSPKPSFSLERPLTSRAPAASAPAKSASIIALDPRAPLLEQTPLEQGVAARPLQKYFIKTYGCQMNELDSEVMEGILQKRGMKAAGDEEEADLLIFNTCSIRDLAERKAMGKIGQLSRQKGEKLIGVTGCMANNKKETLFRKLPAIDFVLGTNNIHQLSSVLDEALLTRSRVQKTDPSFYEELDYAGAKRKSATSAYVSIIRGCDKYCTYCIVPYTRGPEVSRSLDSILDEVEKLAQSGVKEVTLLGQNVNSYGKDLDGKGSSKSVRFHDLLEKIDAIEGIERIRFMTSHPVDITKELMLAVRDLPSLCEFVHFPIQAGSERILKKMHRIYTLEEYLEKVRLFRDIVPHVSLGTDIIVGFPTETDAEFEETYRIFEEIDYHVAFIFAYSERKGAPAARWRDDIPEEVKQERLQRLLELHQRQQEAHRRALLGKEVELLVEKVNSKDGFSLQGRTRCWKNMLLTPPKRIEENPSSMVGSIVRARVDSFHHQTLKGHLITP